MQRRKSAQKEEVDKISQLIWCVRKRPALFNYKLAPQERRRVDIAQGWRDVAEELGGNYTVEECRKKWRNLRDTYHQYRLRKSKYWCLDKWRYKDDLSFLADVYQPKLKSQRSKYAMAKNNASQIDEVKITSIASMIELDESSSASYQKIEEDSLIENDYDDGIEHVVDIDEVQFCDVDAETTGEVAYSDVCLYEDIETNALAVDENVEETDSADVKFSSGVRIQQNSDEQCSKNSHLFIGNETDELDLFFQFLKTKIQKLPSADITAIQIEFLNAVLRKETANAAK